MCSGVFDGLVSALYAAFWQWHSISAPYSMMRWFLVGREGCIRVGLPLLQQQQQPLGKWLFVLAGFRGPFYLGMPWVARE